MTLSKELLRLSGIEIGVDVARIGVGQRQFGRGATSGVNLAPISGGRRLPA